MKRLLILTTVVMMLAASGAEAREVTAVVTIGDCTARIVAPMVAPVAELIEAAEFVEFAPIPDVVEILELTSIPVTTEIKSFAVSAKSAARDVTVTVETESGSSVGVVFTVAKALGKAVLKAIATLIHQIV